MSKLTTAVLLVFCASLATLALADQKTEDRNQLTFYFADARGFLQGFEKGLYKRTNYVVNATCLGPKVVNDSLKVYEMIFKQENKDWFEILKFLQRISHQQTAYCDFDDVLFDMLRWCDTQDCTIDFMLQNILKKVIQITTVATNISNILNDPNPKPPITDTKYYFTNWETIGSETGKCIRYLTDFDITKLPTN